VNSIVDQAYWDEVAEKIPLVYKPHNIELQEVFQRCLKPGGSCFEVGCYPGRYLVYLGKKFGYTVNGIDATSYVLTRMPPFLEENGLKAGDIYQGEFMSFKFDKTYDVVLSFGFVEHFVNLEEVIKKHVEIVSPGGILIIACPNFRRLQYLLHWLLDPETLKRHVLTSMDLSCWKEILTSCGMETLDEGYWRTADFWADAPRSSALAKWAIRWTERITKGIDKRTNWPNPFLSPFMYNVSRKSKKESF